MTSHSMINRRTSAGIVGSLLTQALLSLLGLRMLLQILVGCSMSPRIVPTTKKLPDLGFVIGRKHVLNLSPHDYVDKSTSYCDINLMALDVPPPKGPLFVFGIPFLQKYFTVYDHGNNRVGFAVAKHAGQKPPVLMTMHESERENERMV